MTTTEVQRPSDEDQIREAIEAYMNAVRNKDIDAIAACYAADVVAFDIPPPIRYVGRDEYRKTWEMGFNMMKGELHYEMRELKVNVSGDLGCCWAVAHMTSDDMDAWSRWTACFKRTKGRWLVVHEHNSFPIDMESSKALFDQQP
jgi:ketosteroid isomerase-like protein